MFKRRMSLRHRKGQDGSEPGSADHIIMLLHGDHEDGCQGAGLPQDLQHLYHHVADDLFR